MIKWIFRLLGGAIALVVLTVAALAGLPWLTVFGDRFGAGAYTAHLQANETVLNLDAQDAGFVLSSDDLAARYIILGEMHGFALPQDLDLALVAYLTDNGPPRWYLAEMTPREAITVNHYLTGGDDAYVRAVFDRFADLGVQWANNEFFNKLTALQALNQTLPPDRQVRFIGIDRDREGQLLALPDEPIDANPDLGDPATARAINERLLAIQTMGGSRYAAMRARMSALTGLPGFAEARFVGLWGLFHASKAPINGEGTMSMWLQDPAAPYAGEVISINTICIGECFNMMPAAALPEPMSGPDSEQYTYIPMGVDNPYFQRPRGIGDLAKVLGPDRAALYRIAGEQSPYNAGERLTASSGYLAMAQPWEIAGPAAQMTDYIALYRGSAPLTPWSGSAFDLTGKAVDAIEQASP